MATLDKVKMTLPNGNVYEATGNISVTESQQPFWLFDGANRLRTLGESLGLLDSDTAQAYVGSGSRIRSWTVEFMQWEGSTDSWGNANNSDDIMVKLNELGQQLATADIDSTNPATLEFGEYTGGGDQIALTVVPGDVNLPVAFGPGESATTARPSIQWFDAADLTTAIHGAP